MEWEQGEMEAKLKSYTEGEGEAGSKFHALCSTTTIQDSFPKQVAYSFISPPNLSFDLNHIVC